MGNLPIEWQEPEPGTEAVMQCLITYTELLMHSAQPESSSAARQMNEEFRRRQARMKSGRRVEETN